MDLGIKIEAHLDKENCTSIPSINPGDTRFFIKLNQIDELECWLAEGNNKNLGILIGKDDKYLKTLMDRYSYPALSLNGLIIEYDTDYPKFRVHVRVWINYGDKVPYDNYIRMVGNMFIEAREDWYDGVRVCSYSPDNSYYDR